MSGKTPMTPSDAARIQAAEAKQGGGGVEKGGFAARAQAAAAQNVASGKTSPGTQGGVKK
ncbi:seed maturation family [Chlorella sorokiniana]|uniref:Seed maturation family n=1 Tax=Chlorella sorokiniana TaxID=3076 RepID=A0A2P6TBY9_CHLSO|nr:seed maturation family [Chlorella sorokiniana]|eukprot:PRW18408.1 seed maturation family [Chlorella sorokiniana]